MDKKIEILTHLYIKCLSVKLQRKVVKVASCCPLLAGGRMAPLLVPKQNHRKWSSLLSHIPECQSCVVRCTKDSGASVLQKKRTEILSGRLFVDKLTF